LGIITRFGSPAVISWKEAASYQTRLVAKTIAQPLRTGCEIRIELDEAAIRPRAGQQRFCI
jgi:hypothetical protein